jgi:hypothetical protein
MVLGCAESDANVPSANQCAETERIAAGLGIRAPSSFQLCEKEFSSMAFMGDPCPTKITGMRMRSRPASRRLLLKYNINQPSVNSISPRGEIVQRAARV